MIMKSHGFTLVELVVVIAIIAILTTIGTMQFAGYSRKTNIENQTRKLYDDIMEMRSLALYEKRNRGLRLSASSYKLYSSETMSVNPVTTVNLTTPITYNSGSDIIFDTRGLLKTVDNSTICVSSSNDASVDSVVVSMTKITLGKLDDGASCVHDNITSK